MKPQFKSPGDVLKYLELHKQYFNFYPDQLTIDEDLYTKCIDWLIKYSPITYNDYRLKKDTNTQNILSLKIYGTNLIKERK